MNSRIKKLNEQNNLLDKQISEENQEVFTNMICYLRVSNISEYEIEVVRQDLTEMILSAQSRGENINSLFNGDYKQFCDNVIENLPPKSKKTKTTDALDIICWCLSILFAINIIISKDTLAIMKAFVKNTTVKWNISVSIGSTVSIVLIIVAANVIVNQIMKNAFSKEIKHKKTIAFVCGFGAMFGFIVIAWLGKTTLFSINIFVACVLTILLFVFHKILESI